MVQSSFSSVDSSQYLCLLFQLDGKTMEIFQMDEEIEGPTEVFTGEPGF